MMTYGAQEIGIQRFFVKIKDGNDGSRKMFEGLGFVVVRYVECFGETELEKWVDNNRGDTEGGELKVLDFVEPEIRTK